MPTPRARRPVLGFWARSLLVLAASPFVVAWFALSVPFVGRDAVNARADRAGYAVRDWCIAGRGE